MLEITTFGGLKISTDGVEVASLRSRKVEALLVYVASSEQPQSRSSLASLFWGDRDEKRALANLRVALSDLRKHLGDYLIISRDTVSLDPQTTIRLDAHELVSAFEAEDFTRVVDLYGGDFLEGFFVSKCPQFDNWVTSEADRYRRFTKNALHELIQQSIKHREYDNGLMQSRQALALDPLDESTHRAIMRLYVLTDQRNAALNQFTTCRDALMNELGVDPSGETVELYEQIRGGRLKTDPPDISREDMLAEQPDEPDFVREADLESPSPEMLFVGREGEQWVLNSKLDILNKYDMQVHFICGEAGIGKTALIHTFTDTALESHADVVIAWGKCHAYSGISDPYLPFREIFKMLIGDVEGMWKAGDISRDHANRLWGILPDVIPAILNSGLDLLGALIPQERFTKQSRHLPNIPQKEIFEWLQLSEKRRAHYQPADQGPILEQCALVLEEIANKYPLVLILDDLHWVDDASINLLFYLVRRLANSPIFIVGAYRPQEISAKKDGERHPLEGLILEFKRMYGEIFSDLDQVDSEEGERFTNALVDAFPNKLNADFRQRLHQHTGGHPFFILELFNHLRSNGYLVQDNDGDFIQKGPINWADIPVKIEGILEGRLSHLDAEIKEILKIACVEGDEFTFEVIQRVSGTPERKLLSRLSEELIEDQRLIRESSAGYLGEQVVSKYRFAHILFQQYLYNALKRAEKRKIHLAVGQELESVYDQYLDQIASRLAYHFEACGEVEKALTYFELAGERAHTHFALQDSATFFTKALELVIKDDEQKRIELLLKREAVYEIIADRENQLVDIEALEALADYENEPGFKAEIALRRALYEYRTGNYNGCIEASQDAIRHTKTAQDVARESTGNFYWGRAAWKLRDYVKAKNKLNEALLLAERIQFGVIEADCLRNLGILSELEHDIPAAEALYQRALLRHREMEDQRGVGYTLSDLGILYRVAADYYKSKDYLDQSLLVWEEIGDSLGYGIWCAHMGVLHLVMGEWQQAERKLLQALDIHQRIGNRNGEVYTLQDLGKLYLYRGEFSKAREFIESASPIWGEIHNRIGEAWNHHTKGQYHLYLGDYENATRALLRAKEIFDEYDDPVGIAETADRFSVLYSQMGEYSQAQKQSNEVTHIAQKIKNPNIEAMGFKSMARALLGMDLLDLAIAANLRAVELFQSIHRHHMVFEPVAGLAQISLESGNIPEALTRVTIILDHLEAYTMDGNDDPGYVYLTCARVLKMANDPRTRDLLEKANQFLQTRRGTIEDGEARSSFDEQIPSHRHLMGLFKGEKKAGCDPGQ